MTDNYLISNDVDLFGLQAPSLSNIKSTLSGRLLKAENSAFSLSSSTTANLVSDTTDASITANKIMIGNGTKEIKISSAEIQSGSLALASGSAIKINGRDCMKIFGTNEITLTDAAGNRNLVRVGSELEVSDKTDENLKTCLVYDTVADRGTLYAKKEGIGYKDVQIGVTANPKNLYLGTGVSYYIGTTRVSSEAGIGPYQNAYPTAGGKVACINEIERHIFQTISAATPSVNSLPFSVFAPYSLQGISLVANMLAGVSASLGGNLVRNGVFVQALVPATVLIGYTRVSLGIFPPVTLDVGGVYYIEFVAVVGLGEDIVLSTYFLD